MLSSFQVVAIATRLFWILFWPLTLILTPFQRLFTWLTSKSTKDILLESLRDARLFEEWEAAAYQLDEVLRYDMWYAAS